MRRVYGGPHDGELLKGFGLHYKAFVNWGEYGLYRTEYYVRLLDKGPPVRAESRAVWVWQDDSAPDATAVFADTETESSIMTQPADLWRNHTTE